MKEISRAFEQSRRVFVYGTLRRGGSNHWRMDGADSLGGAEVNGRLYAIDWYPGLIVDPAAGPVTGDLFELNSTDQLAGLDAYEGPEYTRRLVTIEGRETWLWEFIREVDESRRIPSGDWLEQV